MVFEYGMGEGAVARTMRADNYALSEETKRMRDQEQARLTDHAYERGAAADREAPRCSLDRVASALLEKETLTARTCSSSSATSSPSRARGDRRRDPSAERRSKRLVRELAKHGCVVVTH